ncbi:MAG: class I SAM-dependent rRNA methyltransferase [Patescibacteria group bacterium]
MNIDVISIFKIMIKLKIKNKRRGPVLGRHPWIFSQAFLNIPEGLESGDPVAVYSENDEFLGQGYFNSYSQIAVRLWSYDENEIIDQNFFDKRVTNAFRLRQNYVLNKLTDSCRIIYAENDFLPGLVVDKYDSYLSVQFHTKGMEKWKTEIVSSLNQIIKPKAIFERSEVKNREVEESAGVSQIICGDMPDKIIIKENGLKFFVDIKGGQKTGFFLDQREKRFALQKYVKDKNLLNCFCYTGGFSIYALAAGVKSVTNVDVSAPAMELLKENIELNKLSAKNCEFLVTDAKEYLHNLEKNKFDAIILDPPAFIKSRHHKDKGIVGYKKINEIAMAKIAPDGILLTASCSAHLKLDEFRYIISEAQARSHRSAQILETHIHSSDHPELVAFTETEYLKCFILKIVE